MFNLDEILPSHFDNSFTGKIKKSILRKLVREKDFHEFSAKYPHLRGIECVEQILDYFDVSSQYVADDLENIPVEGPIIIVSNHPIGSLDGLLLLKLISKVRPDIKVVANQFLSYLKPISSLFIGVDNINQSTQRKQIEAMHQQLKNKGCLLIFPSGEVSRVKPKGVRDPRWQTGFIKLAIKYRAPIIPIHVQAKNSFLFYTVSWLYRPLSTLMLVREMFKQRGKTITVKIGQMIPLENFTDQGMPLSDLARRFRKHVYRLASGRALLFATRSPIAAPEERKMLKKHIEAQQSLGKTPDGKSIYLYRREDESNSILLRELGRLREIAFRAVGEGTGLRRDVDIYDDYYYQLMLWDPEELEIVGAYRLIPTNEIVKQKGIESLYTHSLFIYNTQMNEYFEKGVELGRSFIQPKYWGLRGLDYLWQGIGAFLAAYPEHKYLLGPVTISGAMPTKAKDLLVAFYRLYFQHTIELAKSRAPYPESQPEILSYFSGDDYTNDFVTLKSLLANMNCSVPTLYKQYTELCESGGAKFLDFGIDASFCDSIDGLVLIDLDKIKPQKFQRYISIHLSHNPSIN
ncbi:lysophospholipid acyltransferase family protein [Thorsellia kenyensis]|uniref:L-ornithine N(alpha)-acyltransferase n=1 Tax=Thorsellia kenyensis TaxID=1549888 RepID=A0ABV6C781_9GAMM